MFLLLIVFSIQRSAAAQTGTAPLQPSYQRGVAKPEPMGDFVPCLFDGDQQWTLRSFAVPQPPSASTPLTAANVQAALDNVRASLQTSGFAPAIVNAAVAAIKPEDYVEMFPAVAAKAMIDGAATAITTISKQRQKPEITNAQVMAAINVVTRAMHSTLEPSQQTYKRPLDVSCSMSILSWQETSDTFGRRIANQYLAIQVNVRNLNRQNEFLIHDVQVAVDTGVGQDYFALFHSGRDKLLVRAVAQRGQFEDRRNLVINSLQLVGAVAAVPSASMSNEFSTAVAVFEGQFVPGLANVVFPDHTVQQINNINDLGFSSSSTNKTIVPIQGSVPLVTFIAQKPIQQLPFAWCGYANKHWIHWSQRYCAVPGLNTDVSAWNETNPRQLTQLSTSSTMDPVWNALSYKKWKPAALRILQQNTYVVVGGVHIKEVNSSPTIDNLNCPTLTSGSLDLSQPTNDEIACTITGSGLGAVSSVQLGPEADKINGTIKPATDGASAQILFKPVDLASKAGNYKLYFVDSQGDATDSQNAIQLSQQPVILAVSPSSGKAQTLFTITGINLSLAKSFEAVSDAASSSASPEKPISLDIKSPKGDTSEDVQFPAASAPGTYHLRYTSDALPGKNFDRPDIKMTVNGP